MKAEFRILQLFILSVLSVEASISPVTSVPGDVSFAGLFTLNSSTSSSECNGKVSTSSVMELEAVKWAIRRLNDNNYIPGVKIGLIAYPTCQLEHLAGYRAIEISTAIKKKSQNILGIIGARRSSESESVATILARLPDTISPPMMSYSSTSVSLSDKTRFPNFFRTIYSDHIQIEVITSLMLELQWNYVSIVHENSAYGLHGAETLQMALEKHGICIRTINGFNTTYGVEISLLNQIIKNITSPADGAVSGIMFFGDQISAEKFLTALADLKLGGDTPSVIFSEGAGTSKAVFNDRTLPASRGNLVVSPTYQPVEEFLTHWRNIFQNKTLLAEEKITNPWLEDVLKDIKTCGNCEVPEVPTAEDVNNAASNNIYVKFALETVCMFAKALKDSRHSLCSNDNCSSLQDNAMNTFSTSLKSVDVNVSAEFGAILPLNSRLKFDKNGDIDLKVKRFELSVYNHRKCLIDNAKFCFVQVAKYFDDKISINRTLLKDYDQGGLERSYHKAQCKQGDICTACLSMNEHLYYKPGDLIIVAAFPIHNVGTGPLRCGGLRSNTGLDVALAVEHAVEMINNDSTIFSGTPIGFIILDTCNDPLIIQQRILHLFKKDGYPRLPPDIADRILGYVGSLGSTPTIAMVSVTKKLEGKPQVGCCSTSQLLSNKEHYPNFVRVSTPLDRTADTMVQIAKKLNARYIQIIYSSGSYGEGGRNAIISSARKYGVCVANSIEVPEKSNYNTVLDKLRVKPSAKVVLTFLRSHVGPHVMQVTANRMQEDGEFYFIASETLGTRTQYLIPRLRGTVSVAQVMPQGTSYLQYLRTKSPKPTDDNSWLLDIIQSRQRCYFPWSFNKSDALTRQCGSSDHIFNNASLLVDPWAPYLLNAALALLKGSASALREICQTTKTICSGYSNTNKVLQHIKEVKLDLNQNGSSVPVFDEDGNGIYGHTIYTIVSEKGKLIFKTIGHWSQSAGLTFGQEDEIFPGYPGQTKCPNPQDCKVCNSFLRTEGSDSDVGATKSSDQSTTAYIPLIAAVAVTSFLAILFIALFSYQCYQKRQEADDPYIIPSSMEGIGNECYMEVRDTQTPISTDESDCAGNKFY
ncbi:uncharacterized protein LOC133183871 [Saccostrea echinata]|uniref:uncharacterized protein LOC133183871 n=1 Tax=Saccostrea echinata TaxID=191078 RepID=UPI002A835125|nr:uncharacterized protein LOC133183871 [Saccostrea echinata]